MFFLIVCLSTPIKKSIFFARIRETATGAPVADFGMFGVCWHAHRGLPKSCSRHGVGWRLDEQRLGFEVPRHFAIRLWRLSRSLAMNVIVTIFAGLSDIIWMVAFFMNSRSPAIRVVS